MRILTAGLIALLVGTALGAGAPASACTRIGSIAIGSDCDDTDDGDAEPGGPGGSAARAAERRFFHLLNAARARAGLPRLVSDPDAARIALAHSATMARRGKIYHSALPTGPGSVGENVGFGPSAASIHTAFMRSAAHRANIMRGFSSVGIGVRVQGETLWVTQLFVLRSIPPHAGMIGGSLRSISPLQLLGEPLRAGSTAIGPISRAEGTARARRILSGATAMLASFAAIAMVVGRRYRRKRSNA